jgi:hypothetical protein
MRNIYLLKTFALTGPLHSNTNRPLPNNFQYTREDFIKHFGAVVNHIYVCQIFCNFHHAKLSGVRQLRSLVEALYIINKVHGLKREKLVVPLTPELREEIEKRNQPTTLNKEQLANPIPVIKQFCKRFTRQFTDREIRDWLEAEIKYTVNTRKQSVRNIF